MDDLGIIISDIFMQRYHVAFDKNLGRIGLKTPPVLLSSLGPVDNL